MYLKLTKHTYKVHIKYEKNLIFEICAFANLPMIKNIKDFVAFENLKCIYDK